MQARVTQRRASVWRLPLAYGVSFPVVCGALWLLCELAWRRLRHAGTADDHVSARWVENLNTER